MFHHIGLASKCVLLFNEAGTMIFRICCATEKGFSITRNNRMKRILSMTAAALMGTSILAGAAYAQDSGGGISVGADVGADVGVSVGSGDDSGGANVDAGADVGADVGVDAGDDGASVDAGADAGVDAGAGADGGDDGDSGGDAGADAGADAGGGADAGADMGGDDGAEAGADANVDASANAGSSATLSDEDQAFFNEMGGAADGFFTDESRAQVGGEAEIQGAFANLSDQQQQMLRDECAAPGSSAPSAPMSVLQSDICPAIGSM